MTADVPAFSIELFDQQWLGDGVGDPCTHGSLRIVINGVVIVDRDEDVDVGISKSALALSRTLLSNHSPDDPVAPRLIHHGCGMATTLFFGCPIGANWSVVHEGEFVRISDVVRWDTTSDVPTHVFSGSRVNVAIQQYEAEIIALAQAALRFAAAAEKRIEDDWERAEWIGWQVELRRTLAEVNVRHTGGRVRDGGSTPPSCKVVVTYRLRSLYQSNTDELEEVDRFVGSVLNTLERAGLPIAVRDFSGAPGYVQFRIHAWGGTSDDDVRRVIQPLIDGHAPAGSMIGDFPTVDPSSYRANFQRRVGATIGLAWLSAYGCYRIARLAI